MSPAAPHFPAAPLVPEWSAWTPRERAVLLFVIRDEKILLIDKKRGLGAGKVNGPGGKIDPGETALEAAVRETREEVGIEALSPEFCGELFFQFADGFSIHCTVYRAEQYHGKLMETPEAVPFWVNLDRVPFERMWADDAHWFPWMLERRLFRGYFEFDGDRMLSRRMEEYQSASQPAGM